MEFACLLPTRLRNVPPDLDASRFAVAAASHLLRFDGRPCAAGFDLVASLEGLGCRVDIRPLQADRGGVRAAMSPFGDRYWFVIDPTPAPAAANAIGEIGREGRSLVQWRLGHEVGHVLFRDFAGRRLCAVTEAEERFCNNFAGALLAELSIDVEAAVA